MNAPRASEMWPPAEPGEGLEAARSNPPSRTLPDGSTLHHPDDAYGPPAPMAARGGHQFNDEEGTE